MFTLILVGVCACMFSGIVSGNTPDTCFADSCGDEGPPLTGIQLLLSISIFVTVEGGLGFCNVRIGARGTCMYTWCSCVDTSLDCRVGTYFGG